MILCYLGPLFLAATALATAVPRHYIEHERRDHSHNGNDWTKRERVGKHQVLPFRVGLIQQNLEKGHDLLMAMADPDSDTYGQHWTEEEVIQFFAPHQDSVDAVHSWLVEHGGFHRARISVSTNKQWIQIDATTEELESLLQTEYHVYEHNRNSKRSVAADRYHIPRHLRDHIDYVTPGVRLLEVSAPAERKRDLSGHRKPYAKPIPKHLANAESLKIARDCDQLITPACIRGKFLSHVSRSRDALEIC
jgi:tripeptidyl-peptidase I